MIDTTSTNQGDAYLRSDLPNYNTSTENQIDPWISGYTWNGLIKFTLPAGTGAITKVRLFLYAFNNSGDPGGNIEVHQITQTNWNPANVTWNQYDGINNWATPGGDYNSSIIDSILPVKNTWTSWIIMGTGGSGTPLTLNWGDNVHLLLKGADWDFYSKEYSNASYRPYLEITYSPQQTGKARLTKAMPHIQFGKTRITPAVAPTGIYFYANGTDRTNYIDWQSFTIEDLINNQVDNCSFRTKKYGSKTWVPALSDTIRIMNGLDDIFGGIIVQIEKSIDSLILSYKVDCKDYTHYLDRFLVTEQFTNQTVNYIIAYIANKYLTNFSSFNVNCATVIPTISFDKMTVSQCLQDLAERVNYSWYVDPYKDIHFITQASEASPFGLTDTNGNYNFGSLVINEDITQLRNKIYIQGTGTVSAQVQDATSIATYGTYEYSLTDTTILSNDEATQYANAMLAAYAYSLKSGTFITYQYGLRSGQLINIQSTIRGLNENLIIQRVTLTMHTPSNPMWTVEFATLRDLGIIQFFQKILIFQADLAANI